MYRSSNGAAADDKFHPRYDNKKNNEDAYVHASSASAHDISSSTDGSGYVKLRVGNHLRSVHPSPIRSDQVIYVPSLFGSELNWTTFEDVRTELEPSFRAKYSAMHKVKKWALEGVRDNSILTVSVSRGGLGAVTPVTKVMTKDVETKAEGRTAFDDDDDDDDGDDDDTGASDGNNGSCSNMDDAPGHCLSICHSLGNQSGDTAVKQLAHRVCQYFSIDPETALINAGIRLGHPVLRTKARQAHLSPKKNCFVVVTLGSPRVLVLRRQEHDNPRFCVVLSNNSATAIMVDVTNQGWLYGIESLTGDQLDDDVGRFGATTNGRPETITLFICGQCTTMVGNDASAVRPQRLLPPTFPQSRRVSSDGNDVRRSSTGLDDASWKDSRDEGNLCRASSTDIHWEGRRRTERGYQRRSSSETARKDNDGNHNGRGVEDDDLVSKNSWRYAVESYQSQLREDAYDRQRHRQDPRPRHGEEYEDRRGRSSSATHDRHCHYESYRRSRSSSRSRSRSRSRSPSAHRRHRYKRSRSGSPH